MRTVSFSQPAVRNLFNQNFVNTFTNTFGDPTAGLSIRHRPNDPAGSCVRGNGKQNVQTIFLTPEGDIFHVATGYLDGNDLVKEGKFALQLFQDLKSLARNKARRGKTENEVASAHKQRLTHLGMEQVDRSSPMTEMMTQMNVVPVDLSSNNSVGFPGTDMFRKFGEVQFRSDNQFSIDHPLMNYKQLESNPAVLVGNGKSFFASSGS